MKPYRATEISDAPIVIGLRPPSSAVGSLHSRARFGAGAELGLKRRGDQRRRGPKQIGQLLRRDRFAEQKTR
jgi:hypothetical protein